jgi:hypothetical protein
MSALDRRQLLRHAGLAASAGLLGGLVPRSAHAAYPDPERAGYVPVQGGRAWYRINGSGHFASGQTPLLVIHGGPGFSHHYLLALSALSVDRPVIF